MVEAGGAIRDVEESRVFEDVYNVQVLVCLCVFECVCVCARVFVGVCLCLLCASYKRCGI